MQRFIIVFVLITGMIVIPGCIRKTDQNLIEDGVSKELAILRGMQLENVVYDLSVHIPDSLNEKVTGRITITFSLKNKNNPVIIDFRNSPENIKNLDINGKLVKPRFVNHHIIIPKNKLKTGKNNITLSFISSDLSLNRNPDYLYTLFVPDRASTAFPCFDQPDIKAKFKLLLQIPVSWNALSNGSKINEVENENYKEIQFDETHPISTYLFAFTAGKFIELPLKFNNHSFNLYYRQSLEDSLLIENIQEITTLQGKSLEWLEDYTNIDQPFQKYDIILIPSFQYSGMEHPGAVYYRESKLLLSSSSTIQEELNRANLIAHETAHMWFGNLVTMKWFNEVWLKEVFANFMAAKIINPLFPEINHELNFLLSHYPPALAVDRTEGANAVQQRLNNMLSAGSLYGNIIYHKAPIVFKNLEFFMGEEAMKKSIRKYLSKYAYANATWFELTAIFQEFTDFDLADFSYDWIETPGFPKLKAERAYGINNTVGSFVISQKDMNELGRTWANQIDLSYMINDHLYYKKIFMNDTFYAVINEVGGNPEFLYLNSSGNTYGYQELDESSIDFLMNHISVLESDLLRGSAYITIWENLLQYNVEPRIYSEFLIKAIESEDNSQNLLLLMDHTKKFFWQLTNQKFRMEYSGKIEKVIWERLNTETNKKVKYGLFRTYSKISLSDESLLKLYNIWTGEKKIGGLTLSEDDKIDLSFEIKIRDQKNLYAITSKQLRTLKDQEKINRYKFIEPALSSDPKTRDEFFNFLKLEKNREKEPWVIDALYYLHHPLYSDHSQKYLYGSLAILEELKQTGDIFFPKRWLDATLGYYNSTKSIITVSNFLNENLDFPEDLNNKILQAYDMVVRGGIISDKLKQSKEHSNDQSR